jgi:hypothetical protein
MVSRISLRFTELTRNTRQVSQLRPLSYVVMWKRCRSLDPRKPSKKRYFRKSLLEFARQQERQGEKTGTRQKRLQALPHALPATGSSSIARVPTPTQSFGRSSFSGSFITNTALEHAELATTVHNNQTVPPNTLAQSELEHHHFFDISQHPSTTATTSFGSTSGDDSQDTSTTFTTQSTNLGESSLNNEGLLSELSPLASWTHLWFVFLTLASVVVLTLPKDLRRFVYSGRSEPQIIPRLLGLVQPVCHVAG